MTVSPLPVHYLGDSHVRYFKKAAKIGLLAPHELSGVEVGGATAVGMRNPNSKTDAIGRFRRWIREKSRESIVVLHLGEVDCGFVVWYRAEKHDEPVELQVDNSLDAYFEFVDELLDMGFHRLIVTGATLPTITDDDQVGEVVVKRSAITATQKERTDLTLRYNAELRRRAAERGLPYVDIDQDVLDPRTGVVDERMRNPNPEDHHMNGSLAAALWARKLREAIAIYQRLPHAPRHWTCTHDSFLKAYPGHSKNMPTGMRQRVEVGDVVTGDEVTTSGQYTVIRDARVNGEEFPLLSMLHTHHYGPAERPASGSSSGPVGLLRRALSRRAGPRSRAGSS
ncbi:hypothetical protein [Brachybacterium subflavum]|uniref:hypothetical protein n=1 Tax=Brachybacterium subflavum TaxID=2585206 RepID=UPI0012662092|nr:hypothetical protein [Brachybacterium subflavum]